jgi:putative ABC transport system permease protein
MYWMYVEMFALGIRNMRGYPLRSILTMLGISFGIASVIAMFATGEGAKAEILAQIGRLGIRNIIVNSVKPATDQNDAAGATSFISRYGLTFRDEAQIRETIGTTSAVLPVHTLRSIVWQGSRKIDGRIHGVLPAHMKLLKMNVVAGRNLTSIDNARLNQVCVIREGLLRQLNFFGEPIGHMLQVGNEFYEIVGVLADEEFTSLTRKALNVDNKASELYAPYETILRRHGTVNYVQTSGTFEGTDIELDQIIVEVDEQDNVLTTARMIEQVLESFHDQRDYEMVVPLELLAQRRKTQQVFSFALIVIASISLLVGGIGIANIMLASITERTREIGVRRAMGAKRRHIVAQFLTETVTLSFAGGIFGLLLAVVFLLLLESLAGWASIVPAWVILLSIGISCIVGVLAGIWPATRAARMDPIGALRHE